MWSCTNGSYFSNSVTEANRVEEGMGHALSLDITLALKDFYLSVCNLHFDQSYCLDFILKNSTLLHILDLSSVKKCKNKIPYVLPLIQNTPSFLCFLRLHTNLIGSQKFAKIVWN